MIQIKVRVAQNLYKKTIGLIGKDKPESLLIKTRFGIHTFGLKFPIDVVVLDNNIVVQAKSHLCPNNLFFWNPKYDQILELPDGTIKRLRIKPGSHIILSHF
jgi:uncharacterized protein